MTAPVIWPADVPEQDTARQRLALEGLDLGLSGISAQSVGQVRAELEAAGFVETRADDLVFIHVVRGRRPVG